MLIQHQIIIFMQTGRCRWIFTHLYSILV